MQDLIRACVLNARIDQRRALAYELCDCFVIFDLSSFKVSIPAANSHELDIAVISAMSGVPILKFQLVRQTLTKLTCQPSRSGQTKFRGKLSQTGQAKSHEVDRQTLTKWTDKPSRSGQTNSHEVDSSGENVELNDVMFAIVVVGTFRIT